MDKIFTIFKLNFPDIGFRQNFNSFFHSKPKVVFVERVFCIFAAANHAPCTIRTWISQRSLTTEIWIAWSFIFIEIYCNVNIIKRFFFT